MLIKKMNKKLHILWINEHAAPVGGCEGYIRDMALLLKEQGVESTILYEVSGQRDTQWMKSFDRVFPQVDLKRQIDDIQPSLIYIHRSSGIKPIQQIQQCNIPTVRFFHDHKLFCLREHKYTTIGQVVCTKPVGIRCYPCLGFLNKSEHWPGIRLKLVGHLLREQRINMKLDAFVAASTYMSKHIVAHGFEASKVHTIPIFSPPPVTDSSIHREDDLLLFVGQLNRGKGLDTLLQAIAKTASKVRLIAAGSGEQENEFRILRQDLGIEERVQFVGKISPLELRYYYQKASCLIFPSRAPETFGLSGTEAMSYGLPVIASDVGGVRQWLINEMTGFLFPPSNPDVLAEKIDQLMSDRRLYDKFSHNAKERFQSNFLPEQHIEQLMQLFHSLTTKEKPTS
jgi:glycosyltransferase involved in cell wall biosynthesis